jgi:hypothetical protein
MPARCQSRGRGNRGVVEYGGRRHEYPARTKARAGPRSDLVGNRWRAPRGVRCCRIPGRAAGRHRSRPQAMLLVKRTRDYRGVGVCRSRRYGVT